LTPLTWARVRRGCLHLDFSRNVFGASLFDDGFKERKLGFEPIWIDITVNAHVKVFGNDRRANPQILPWIFLAHFGDCRHAVDSEMLAQPSQEVRVSRSLNSRGRPFFTGCRVELKRVR
jgi:hypothetical protein